MADDAVVETITEIPPAPEPHPLDNGIDEVAKFTTEDIRGTSRLGTLAFDTAPQQVQQILQTLRDIRLEPWDEFDDVFKNTVIGQVNGLLSTLEAIRQLKASDPNAQSQRDSFQTTLNGTAEWFRANARPRAIQARVNEALAKQDGLTQEQEETERLRAEIGELRNQLSEARESAAQLAAQVRPVVEAGRQAAGTSGAAELAKDYNAQAKRHDEAGDRWQWLFLVACVVAVVCSILVVSIDHPSGRATTAAAVGRFFIDLLVIGVLLYLVRIASLQYRVNRHLAAIARSKAAALETFARMVQTGTDPSTRDALATTLAQTVFTPGDTGLIDAGSEHITLIERVMATGSQRLSGG